MTLRFVEAADHDEPHNRYSPLTICDDDANDVASVYDRDNATVDITREEAVRYVRLFVASEVMLETLKLADGNISSLIAAYPDKYPRHAFQGTLEEIRAAIAAAEGAAP